MVKKLFLTSGFLFLSLCSFVVLVYCDNNYVTYKNDRFSYSISYPDDLLEAQGEAPNGDGQEFRSNDGKVKMLTFGAHFDRSSKRVADLYYESVREVLKGSKGIGKVTYKSVKKDWFVISGVGAEDVFYQKTIVRDNVAKTFSIRYQKPESEIYNAVTEKISQSFKG